MTFQEGFPAFPKALLVRARLRPMAARATFARDRRRRRTGMVLAVRAALVALMAVAGAMLFSQGAWIHAKAMLAQVLLQRAFAQTVATGHKVKPWPWADTWPVAKIAVPRLGARAIVLAGSSGQALAFGPGHVENTPEPGERGVTVYAAHRDTHFRFLKEVKIGDAIEVTRRDGRTFRYRVSATSVVRYDAPGIDPLAPGRHLVLSTCWPFDAVTPGPLRYLVVAEMTAEIAAAR